MRFPRLVCVAMLAVVGSPILVRAQFQEPTKDELQMTSDPKAPGAAAVYLYREETTDDKLHYHSYYERIKVLTEKGKELATIKIPYEHGNFKVTDIHGRTIHADGTVIPLTSKAADLVDVKTKDYQENTMVFTLPSVEVGSILEYRLQLRYDDDMVSSPHWQVQQPYMVRKAHYSFVPSGLGVIDNHGNSANRLMWEIKGPAGTKVAEEHSRYTYDATDVPPIPDEDWMPPLNSLTWRVDFYYTGYMTAGDFWMAEGKRWAKEADRFATPSKTLQQAASQIVGPSDTEEQKARKLYDAVQKLENTSFTRSKSEAEKKKEKIKDIKDAEGAWNEKAGSANELALLYVALARAAGLKAYPMEVVDRNRAIFDPQYLTTWQLDDYIAVVGIGGKEVFVDPGQKMCPFGLLHWKHAGVGGLRTNATGPVAGTTPVPNYQQTKLDRVANLTVDTDGSVSGTIRFVMSGQDALHWRQMTLENDENEVKKTFNETMREYLPDGVQADFDHFLGLEEYNSNLIATVKVSGNLGSVTGKRFFLPGLFFESHAKHPFVAVDKRTIPVDVKYARMETDDVVYYLPDGYTVESTPQTNNVSWANHALLKVKSDPTTKGVEVTRSLAYNYTFLDPKDYGDLHDFYQKVATADQQQLVLTRAQQAAKAN